MHGYPRPQLRRATWTSLNGEWDFAIDHDARWEQPSQVQWERTIRVPYAPETAASGIQEMGLVSACWYHRDIDEAALSDGERLILHFGAVDYEACVWFNDCLVATHEGGYTPFAVDVTPLLRPGSQCIVVRAIDDPFDLAKPRGKQDWQLNPHAIWYPRTTGIWQTVWLEKLPATWIDSLQWDCNLERWEIGLAAQVRGRHLHDSLQLHVSLRAGDEVLASDTYRLTGDHLTRRITLSDPGIDDYRNELLWSPQRPTLIDALIEVRTPDGTVLDRVRSYTALRTVGVQGDRFLLNGRPYRPRMVLDQGYWPESGLTPPDDEALRRDVELAKSMGFNGVRKHQKIEDPRYLYWADRLGLLVWEEMPSATALLSGQWSVSSRNGRRLSLETGVIHASFPGFHLMNPGAFLTCHSLPRSVTMCRLSTILRTPWTPARPVIGNDGWESVATDIVGIHDYDEDTSKIARRYETEEVLPRLFQRERPGGRQLTVEGYPHTGQPIMITEFGGITYAHNPVGTYGYARATSPGDLAGATLSYWTP